MELIMKRITLILFTLVLASSVAGCGFGKKKEEKEQPKTVASQAAVNPYDERVRVLQEEIARLKQRMEIVEDKLNGTRGPRRD